MDKNREGYPDPTAGQAIRAAGHMPAHVYNAYSVIDNVAGLLGFELIGLRDRKTGKEYRKRGGSNGQEHSERVHGRV